MESTVSYTSI